MTRKILSLILSVGLLFQQSGLVYAVGELNLANYLSAMPKAIIQPDRFRPAQLRYISYDLKSNDFKLLLDKGDIVGNGLKPFPTQEEESKLFNYFLIGLALPNDTFWVNLRPDAADNIIDPLLEKTDIGKIFLESDLQLKKDTASFTSPQNPEGKAYWDKLYKKAGELFGTENITIPTITRPWIVPNEVIVRETDDSAYIYKATLKVMLEADYLSSQPSEPNYQPLTSNYSFSDPRLKELNQYSTQLIKDTIIPKLTQEVNSSKRYAQLRQVYYSLVLSRWFKQKYGGIGSTRAPERKSTSNSYIGLINSGNLANLASQEPCDKQTYFQAYQKSFKDGEYNLKETRATPFGQSIRSYISGGISVDSPIKGGEIKNENNHVGRILNDGLIPVSKPVSTASPVSYGKQFEWALSRQKGVSDAAYELARIGLVLLKSGDMEKHRERFEWTLYHQKGSSKAAEEAARIGLLILDKGVDVLFAASPLTQEVYYFFQSLPEYSKGDGGGKEKKPSWDETQSLLENIEKAKKYLADGIGQYSKLAQVFLNSNPQMSPEIDTLLESGMSPDELLKKGMFSMSEETAEYFRRIGKMNEFQEAWNKAFDLGQELIRREKNKTVSGSPVVGKKLMVYDKNTAKNVELRYVTDKESSEIFKKMIKERLQAEVFGSKINMDGKEYDNRREPVSHSFPVVSDRMLEGMHFAVKTEGEKIRSIEGIVYNDGKEIIVYGKTPYIAKAILDVWKKESGVSSAVVSENGVPKVNRGGIDLTDRALQIKLELGGSFASTALVLPEIANVETIDLDNEFKQIQAMVSSSIRPADTRILEFAAACYYKGEFDQRLEQVSSCVKAAHLADERLGKDSSDTLRLATMLPDALYGGRI